VKYHKNTERRYDISSEKIEEFRNYCNSQLDAIEKLLVPNRETLLKRSFIYLF